MPHYDDRDYFYDADSIDELYDDEYVFEEDDYEEDNLCNTWEYDYHNLADELSDE